MTAKPDTASMEIWVLADLRSERLFGQSLNILAKAHELAKGVEGRAAAVVTSAAGQGVSEQAGSMEPDLAVEEAVDQCMAYGADVVYRLEHSALMGLRTDAVGAALARAVEMRSPDLVLVPLTDFGREVASRAARMNDAGLIADCADLKVEQGRVLATCPAWGGQIMAEIGFTDDQRTGFATVQTHICEAKKARGEPGRVERISIEELTIPSGMVLLSRCPEAAEHRKLEDAEVVVVGGAGVGNNEGFGMVRQLAAALGAEVGATR
ncbi:MAG: FAD-binding protein, partial [Deltaproteobacteria bacterium]|nr:FAD-binding protein [Deltaproteobacteria bacterium]